MPCAKLMFLLLLSRSASYTRWFIMIAAIGMNPADSCLAVVRMSGFMPKVCEPQKLPVRPKPQITSSATSSTSYFLSTAWILSQ